MYLSAIQAQFFKSNPGRFTLKTHLSIHLNSMFSLPKNFPPTSSQTSVFRLFHLNPLFLTSPFNFRPSSVFSSYHFLPLSLPIPLSLSLPPPSSFIFAHPHLHPRYPKKNQKMSGQPINARVSVSLIPNFINFNVFYLAQRRLIERFLTVMKFLNFAE